MNERGEVYTKQDILKQILGNWMRKSLGLRPNVLRRKIDPQTLEKFKIKLDIARVSSPSYALLRKTFASIDSFSVLLFEIFLENLD